MKFFHIHPDDARWLHRWLRSNLLGACVIAGLLWGLNCESTLPTNHSTAATVTTTVTGASKSIAPHGWRRTSQGWEHTSTWTPKSKPLAQWIETQEAREPAWIQTILAMLRDVPPLVFALLQIAVIATITFVSRHYHRRSPDQLVT